MTAPAMTDGSDREIPEILFRERLRKCFPAWFRLLWRSRERGAQMRESMLWARWPVFIWRPVHQRKKYAAN